MGKYLIIWGIAAAAAVILLISYFVQKSGNEEDEAISEKRRKTAGKIAKILQIPAALLFVLLIYTSCFPEGYEPILFGQIGSFVSVMLVCMIITIELIAGTSACVIRRKRKWVFPVILLWSFFAFISFFVFLFGRTHYGTRKVAFSDPNTEIIISNWDFLLAGNSEIYEKVGPFLVRELMIVSGDDGWTPLSHPDAHVLIDDGNYIIVHYKDNFCNTWNTQFLRYENGRFILKRSYDNYTRTFQNGECFGGRNFRFDSKDGKEYTHWNEPAGLTVQPSELDGLKMRCIFYRYEESSVHFSFSKAVLEKMDSSDDIFEERELSVFNPVDMEMNQGDRYYLNIPLTEGEKPLPAGKYCLKLYINDQKLPEETLGFKLVFTIR